MTMKSPFLAAAAGLAALMQPTAAQAQTSRPAPTAPAASADIFTDEAMRNCANDMNVSQQSMGQPYFEMFSRNPNSRVWCRFVSEPANNLVTMAFFDANEFRANPNIDMANMRTLFQVQANTQNHTFAVLQKSPGEQIAGAIEISNLGQSNQSVSRSTVITRGGITSAGDSGPFMGSTANEHRANTGIGILQGTMNLAQRLQCSRPVSPSLRQGANPCR